MSLKYTRGTGHRLRWIGKSTKLPHRLTKVLELLDGVTAPRILDIGCGDGRIAALLGEKVGATLIQGVELAAEGVELADKIGVKVSTVDLNEEGLPYADNSFELVFAGEIIEHMLAPDVLLEEVYRVLAPAGGILVLTAPSISSWHCRLQLLLGYQPYVIPIITKHRWIGAMLAKRRSREIYTKEYLVVNAKEGLDHVQFFTCKAICDLIKVHGFTLEQVVGTITDEFTVNLPPVIKSTVRQVDRAVAAIPGLASGVVIKACKETKR